MSVGAAKKARNAGSADQVWAESVCSAGKVVAVARIVAELADDPMGWMAFAAIGWLLAFAPWVLRLGRIYLSPRADGKPG